MLASLLVFLASDTLNLAYGMFSPKSPALLQCDKNHNLISIGSLDLTKPLLHLSNVLRFVTGTVGYKAFCTDAKMSSMPGRSPILAGKTEYCHHQCQVHCHICQYDSHARLAWSPAAPQPTTILFCTTM